MRNSLPGSLTVGLLAIIFVATVLNQLPLRGWLLWVAKIDPWTFLPFWAFFAPKPAYAAISLIYRDHDASSWGDWKEVSVPEPTVWRWLWNPGRFERKALHDLTNGLAWISEQGHTTAELRLSSCYVGLLAWVMAQPAGAPGARSRQFAIVEVVGHPDAREVRPVFLSAEHARD